MDEYNSPCISCCKTEDLFSIFEAHTCDGEEMDPAVDLLNQTFEIQLKSSCSFDAICGLCLLKLRDAFLFKLQVLKNIQDLQLQSHFINDTNKQEDKHEITEVINPETVKLEKVTKTQTNVLKKSENEPDIKGDDISEKAFFVPEVTVIPRVKETEETDSDNIDFNMDMDTRSTVADECDVDLNICSESTVIIECDKTDADVDLGVDLNMNSDTELTITDECDKNKFVSESECNLEQNNDSKIALPKGTSNCEICNQSFKNPLFLTKHMATHTFDGKCDQCGKTFTNKAAKTRHMVSHLKGPFPCKYCDQIFEKLNSRNTHMWRTHKTDTPFICKECGDRFKTLHKRLNHMKEIHGTMNLHYPCPHCDKRFPYAGARWHHIHQSHNIERRHSCTECPMKFKKKRELLNHLATIHDIGEKKFKCHLCLKAFFRSTNLKYHLKRHEKTANLSFKCSQCDSAFAIKALLEYHIKSHEMDSKLKQAITEENALVSPVEDIVVVDDKILDDSNDTVYLEFLEE